MLSRNEITLELKVSNGCKIASPKEQSFIWFIKIIHRSLCHDQIVKMVFSMDEKHFCSAGND
jgi:hypothetical protein